MYFRGTVLLAFTPIIGMYYYTHGTVHVQENATATGITLNHMVSILCIIYNLLTNPEAIGASDSPRQIQRSTVAGVASGGVAFCILILIVSITACFVCKSKIRNRRRSRL